MMADIGQSCLLILEWDTKEMTSLFLSSLFLFFFSFFLADQMALKLKAENKTEKVGENGVKIKV